MIFLNLKDNDTIFEKRRISFEDFDLNPGIINDPMLVIRFQGAYYPWDIAVPIVASLAVFGKPISDASFKKAPTESKAYFSSIRKWWSKNPESLPSSPVFS
jgi:hypothetical protein